MLQEYFKIGVNTQGFLCTLPDLLPGYLPDPSGLPLFLLRLVTETNWDDELLCFQSIAREIGYYYSTLSLENKENKENEKENNEEKDNLNIEETNKTEKSEKTDKSQKNQMSQNFLLSPSSAELFSSFLFPAIRSHLVAPKGCAEDGSTVVQLAALEQLYKIFERC